MPPSLLSPLYKPPALPHSSFTFTTSALSRLLLSCTNSLGPNMLVNFSVATILAFSASALGERISDAFARSRPKANQPVCHSAAPHMTKRIVTDIKCQNGDIGTNEICVCSRCQLVLDAAGKADSRLHSLHTPSTDSTYGHLATRNCKLASTMDG